MNAFHKIDSENNLIFKSFKELLTSKGIHKQNQYLLFGKKSFADYLSKATAVITDESDQNNYQIKKYVLGKSLFRELDVFGTKYPILVLPVPTIEEVTQKEFPNALTLLCPLGDPANLGALIRTAVAFDCNHMVLLKEAASPFHPKSVRAASGALHFMNFYYGPSINDLNDSTQMVALDMNGTKNISWPNTPHILVGEEGPGIPKNLQCKKLKIEISKNSESLNAMVSASIALFSFKNRT